MNSDESIELICVTLSKINDRLRTAKEYSYPSAFYEEFYNILAKTYFQLGAIDYRYGNMIADEQEGRRT